MVWRLLLLYTTLVVLLSATGAVPLPNVKDSLKAAGQAAEKGLAALNLNIFSGQATWFKPVTEGGPTGACGPKEDNNDMIVALNAAQYGPMNKKSKYCGKKIVITGPNGKKVTATINDACPGCKKNSLDLTPALFKKLGDMNTGILKIKWRFAN
ncbi:hypothetical protein VKS41_006375 [Umbelopsis sp. WA50703]